MGNLFALRGVEPAMRRTSALVLAAALLLTSAACGDDDTPVATGGDTGTVSVSITVGGGFVPAGIDFASVPTLVQADGTVFTGGPITMQYPGPALSPVLTGKLAAAEMDHLRDAATAAGLDEDGADFGQPGITDVGTTTITVELDGTEHTTAVYALGFEDQAGGITAAQAAARKKVNAFVTDLTERVTGAADAPFEPSAFQVQAIQSEPASSFTEEPRPNELAWPFPDVALTTEHCIDLTGAQATTFAQTLEGATAITVWTDAAGASWHLAVRATLPDDEPCA